MNRWALTTALVLSIASATTSSFGDGPVIVPPQLASQPKPAYPAGATGEATVVLEVVVDADGAVTDVRVVEGEEPFASAAIEAARAARFEPALRDGRAVAARIKLSTSFTPPPPPRKSLPPPEPEAQAGPAQPIEEVRVTGERDEPKSPMMNRLGRAEMRVVPGAFGDPFRAIDILPGLVPIISGLPFFYLRGAPPSAVGYYIDEVRVPYLFHFAIGPGVIHPALVDEVSVHPAAFPGRYGRYAGGIVAGTTRDPATNWYGEGNVRLIDAGAYVEAPFANGRGTAGVGGRFSYTGALISLLAPNVTITYRDYNARASYAIGDRWRATAFTFGSFDYASETQNGVERVGFASEFHRLDLRLDRRGEDGSVSRIATTVGIDRTRLEGARFAQDILVGLRGRHRAPINRELDVEIGADLMVDHYAGDLPNQFAVPFDEFEQAQAFFAPRTETATGVWGSMTWRPAKGWDLSGTMRTDVFTSAGKTAVGPSPRVSMRVPLARPVAFLGALGIAPQTPAFTIPIPAIGYRGLPGGLGFAYQKSAGLEFALPLKFTLKTVGFHHSYFNLRDFAQDRGDVQFDRPQILPGSPTQAIGLEVFLHRKLSERYSAFASATISRAQLGSRPNVPSAVSPFDRTFVAQIGGIVDMGAGWAASSRFLTYGGWPTDAPTDTVRTGDRLPAFYRLDLRIEKRWSFRTHRYISLVLEGLNVGASKEIVSRQCAPECKNQEFGPVVIPSIGVEGAL